MRIVSPEDAVAVIDSGHQVYVHCAAAAPSVLLDALVARARGDHLRDVSVVHLHIEGPGPHLAPEMAGHIRHRALFIGPNARRAVEEGRADYVPVFLSDVPDLFTSGALHLDAVLVNATPPGRATGSARSGRRSRRSMPPSAPRGPSSSSSTARCRAPSATASSTSTTSTSRSRSTSRRTSTPSARSGTWSGGSAPTWPSSIPDGATLQLGIGAIPAATALFLRDKRDLGIHTEMFTDSVVDLVEAGAITGNAKERNRGKIVTAFVLGTARLYRFMHDNPMVEMRPVDFTNDSAIIRTFRRMVAINSAIEVDLTGQVVADSIGHRMYSGVGGQMDFIRGAALAEQGRAIIALPSTAARGTTSRIVATLQPGAGVVTTRAHVRTVVTEYGVADLFGKSVRERAEALIAIAHPDFRDGLRSELRRH